MTDANVLSRDELKDLMREVLEEHHERIGMPVSTEEARQAAKEDAIFIRRFRRTVDGAASTVGKAVIMAVLAAIIGIFATGWNGKIMH